MTTPTTNEYIVFQADQVLTNDNLNELFNYLDQQNRWTRNKLIGSGIVCGLDITYNSITNFISISDGSGITSEGYLILLPKTVKYDYYIPYTGLPIPQDLPFSYTSPVLSPANTNLPYFKPYCAITPVYLLIDSTKYNTQNPLPASALPLSSLSLNQYAVVLFLEMNEKDLKNCDTQDCNNKGEKIIFTIQPLLVPISSLSGLSTSGKAREIKLKRYNVPDKSLKNTGDVLTAFYTILDSGVLNEIAEAYSYCYTRYKNFLADSQNPFVPAVFYAELKKILDKSWTGNERITIQYLYDYVNDLILAYYEFREVANQMQSGQCCGNESAYPLHLVLGKSDISTTEFRRDPYRCYFSGSALFDNQNAGSEKLRFLFNRMKMIASSNAFAVKLYPKAAEIKITPSFYRDYPLSKRSIPYYYNPAVVNGQTIHQYWDYDKTIAGNDNFNLGYNAYLYNQDNSVTTPLLYDIEEYNFFRIEGHIGQQYKPALSYLLEQRQKFNLPFDVVAVSADLLNTVNTVVPTCNILDLETDFRLLIMEFLSKLFLCIYKYALLPYDANIIGSTEIRKYDISNIVLNHPAENNFLTYFNLEFSTYKYGDFLNNYEPFDKKGASIGNAYLDSIKTGTFKNPVSINSGENVYYMQAYSNQLELLRIVDILFYLLLNTALPDTKAGTFTAQYEKFIAILDRNKLLIARDQNNASVFDECSCEDLLSIAERILILLKEYVRRMNLYQSQLNFLNYYKKHPGLEHKAGVPKGGTFVLVYHEKSERLVQNNPAAIYNESNLKTTGSEITLTSAHIEKILHFVENCGVTPIDKGPIIGILNPGKQPAFDLPNGAIIADFYVPYICCSDCAPLAYILDNTPVTIPPITGTTKICAGAKTTLSNSQVGGTWDSSDSKIASVGQDTGIVTGITAGDATITYTVGTESVSTSVTVNPLPDAITGGDFSINIAAGPVTLKNSTGNGSWSSANTSIATIDSQSGVLTATGVGTTQIFYTIDGCSTFINVKVYEKIA